MFDIIFVVNVAACTAHVLMWVPVALIIAVMAKNDKLDALRYPLARAAIRQPISLFDSPDNFWRNFAWCFGSLTAISMLFVGLESCLHILLNALAIDTGVCLLVWPMLVLQCLVLWLFVSHGFIADCDLVVRVLEIELTEHRRLREIPQSVYDQQLAADAKQIAHLRGKCTIPKQTDKPRNLIRK